MIGLTAENTKENGKMINFMVQAYIQSSLDSTVANSKMTVNQALESLKFSMGIKYKAIGKKESYMAQAIKMIM